MADGGLARILLGYPEMTGQLGKGQGRLLAHRQQTHHGPFVLRQEVPPSARGPGVGKGLLLLLLAAQEGVQQRGRDVQVK